ncbi:DUF262 domain-containing HNH endonuclease family protein [Microbacterium sp. SORGH_AS_0888]|uniref:DUF262 domain-containing protein n=1 Tax=Microbacterium sp. SORGH_AS_0888 TaxID=3041791 RepID=UPI00278171F1|nr:DUF262 domain-containing HNH endonuclease family protein [Microbacterium sp. SORGH_AS_0888]MDQ1128352.1 hypothetical protein [Microbacterium sp. SORGH_AS_0888]
MTLSPAAATNVDATAVGTLAWLSSRVSGIVVPVYQRQYRWDIGGCDQLLSDIRAVADADDGRTHFLASILSTRTEGSDDELVLIDGQQRITTLMLLVAALQHTVRPNDPSLAEEMASVLVRPDDPRRTKLRPHRAWAGVFEDVVLDRGADGAQGSRFADNYAFFRSQIRAEEVPRIWRGLQRLEHVSITLGPHAGAQQIFESLNATGEPLRDHELIHNYVLMGLSHAQQLDVEESFWVPIEQNTGEAIGEFWRHYLVMRTGREVTVWGGRGVYDAFRREFPRLEADSLHDQAAQWRDFSEIYRVLRQPAHAESEAIGRQLAYLNTFGPRLHSLVMRLLSERRHGLRDEAALIEVLEYLQALLLRRTLVGVPLDRIVARLCRAHADGGDALERAIARISPSDERVRVAVKYGALPHPAYVLGRLAGLPRVAGLDVEHVLPVAPGDDWTGDGRRAWRDYGDDEQNSARALTETLGNLTLLEEALAERAMDASFPAKRGLYGTSRVSLSQELGRVESWGTSAIAERTERLTRQLVSLWARPRVTAIDDDGLTPILDAVPRRGWPHGWEREYAYVEYRGEHWEVYDIRHLFRRVFLRLWSDARAAVLEDSARRGGPVYAGQAWHGQWETLDETHSLYLGWDSSYMLSAVQGVLEEAGIAAEVFLKYSYIGEAMR